jgi:hypothetical protein
MRSLTVFCLFQALPLFFTAGASDPYPQVAQDTVFLRQGDKLVGKLIGIDERSIRVQRLLPPLAGASTDAAPIFASVAVLRSDIDHIEFSSVGPHRLMLENASAASVSDVELLWRQARPWLAIRKSPAGEIGLRYGDLLLHSGDPVNLAKALDVFKLIEGESWSRSDAVRARLGRLRAMIGMGMLQETIAEAKEMERTSEEPAVLIEAKFILAKAAEKSLSKFVDDNPRWQEDISVRPERDRLYHQALDLYLYPALFFGSEQELAARGLWSAAEVCRFAGDLRQAVEASRDLVEMYAGTSYAVQAEDFINTLSESSRKQYHETEAKR